MDGSLDCQTDRPTHTVRPSNQPSNGRTTSTRQAGNEKTPSRLTQPLASGNHQCMTIVPRAPLLGPRLVAAQNSGGGNNNNNKSHNSKVYNHGCAVEKRQLGLTDGNRDSELLLRTS